MDILKGSNGNNYCQKEDFFDKTETKLRPVRSFVIRAGKITLGQKNAINSLMPIYGIDYSPNPLIINQSFNKTQPLIIEIGFGMGHATLEIAKNNPHNNYLGIEVHSPGVGSLLMQLDKEKLANLKVIQHDAKEVIANMLAPNSVTGFHIYFPDPWPKKRHHKRRLIQNDFIQLLTDKLQTGGYIHLATDWEDYAQHMLSALSKESNLHNQSLSNDYVTRPDFRPLTKFEQRGLKLGHQIWDLIFIKK